MIKYHVTTKATESATTDYFVSPPSQPVGDTLSEYLKSKGKDWMLKQVRRDRDVGNT